MEVLSATSQKYDPYALFVGVTEEIKLRRLWTNTRLFWKRFKNLTKKELKEQLLERLRVLEAEMGRDRLSPGGAMMTERSWTERPRTAQSWATARAGSVLAAERETITPPS